MSSRPLFFALRNKYLSNIQVQSYINSYRPGVLCIYIGCLTEEQFYQVLEEMDDIIYPDAAVFSDYDIYEDNMLELDEDGYDGNGNHWF